MQLIHPSEQSLFFLQQPCYSHRKIFSMFQTTDKNIRLVHFSDMVAEFLNKYLFYLCNPTPDNLWTWLPLQMYSDSFYHFRRRNCLSGLTFKDFTKDFKKTWGCSYSFQSCYVRCIYMVCYVFILRPHYLGMYHGSVARSPEGNIFTHCNISLSVLKVECESQIYTLLFNL